MSIADAFSMELQHEGALTRKTLARVPEGKLDFKPHEKSMSMGTLAAHIAESIGWGVIVLQQDLFDFDPEKYTPLRPESPKQVVELFDKHLAALQAALKGFEDRAMSATWKMTMKGQTVLELPRAAVLRAMIMSHNVHHRAQLGVYLRLNNVPVPASYGPSADEEP